MTSNFDNFTSESITLILPCEICLRFQNRTSLIMYALTNAKIYTGNETLIQHAVIINNSNIEKVCSISELPLDIKCIDLEGANLSPGFIDLQLNGCGGVMFNDNITVDTLQIMHETNLKSGCTSFLPTLITTSDDDMQTAINVVRQYHKSYQHQSLGLHIEGPYLNKEKKGIHDVNYIRSSNQEMVQYICNNSDVVTKITLSPENNNPEHIKQFYNAGIVVSIGHSNATYLEAKKGFESGISFATHLFNAMTSITGREPGIIGAIYDSPHIYAGIIVDGFHVHYANVRLAHKIKKERLVLVTDATAPAGTNIESFNFVGKTIYYKNGQCIDENGTLGGSALTMMEAIQNSVKHVGIALDEALRMATLYPARALKLDHKLGSIKKNKVANLVVFDQDFNVKATVAGGKYDTQN